MVLLDLVEAVAAGDMVILVDAAPGHSFILPVVATLASRHDQESVAHP